LLRDDAQRPLRNESGFATRFDVADARSGETFEVHGAHPDEPAAREVARGRLTFRLQAGNWENLTVRCVFAEPPAAEAAAALAELVHAWAVLAAHAGFAGGSAPSTASGRFESRFGTPTQPQAAGWPRIQAGEDTLIAAPTGSGKTLAAFLACLDSMIRHGDALPGETQVVYVSPLKALANDVRKNL